MYSSPALGLIVKWLVCRADFTWTGGYWSALLALQACVHCVCMCMCFQLLLEWEAQTPGQHIRDVAEAAKHMLPVRACVRARAHNWLICTGVPKPETALAPCVWLAILNVTRNCCHNCIPHM